MLFQSTFVTVLTLAEVGVAFVDHSRAGRRASSVGLEDGELDAVQFLQFDTEVIKKPTSSELDVGSKNAWLMSESEKRATASTDQASTDQARLDFQASLGFMYTPTVNTQHPMWEFDWPKLWQDKVASCGIVLFLAGILCSAGGIGGGGIYVTVLMVVGGLSVRDAVPLSKAVVFVGSISSLILNMRKTRNAGSGAEKSLIDYNICRIVVPSSLLGTYLGVVMNQIFPSIAILAILTLLLVGMTLMVTRTAFDQYTAEKSEYLSPSVQSASEIREQNAEAQDGTAIAGEESADWKRQAAAASTGVDSAKWSRQEASNCGRLRSKLTQRDIVLALSTLVVVVCSGVFHFHAGRCQSSIHRAHLTLVPECHHPLLSFVGNGLQDGMKSPRISVLLTSISIMTPFLFCAGVMSYCATRCVLYEGWSSNEVLAYSGMAVLTGSLAGLVGIGGGLIFSPFFLIMNVDPSVAVATSSTCVIFTASSTTLQYLFTDRIIMVLTVAYGATNLLASYMGTRFVHFLQDHYGARKSYITSIVAMGVVISAVLSAYKLFIVKDIAVH